MGSKKDDGSSMYNIRGLFQNDEEEKENEKQWLLSLEEVENILRYKFTDKSLLKQAFTHPSFYYPDKSIESYERLEFRGDSALHSMLTVELLSMYPREPPGVLTKLRSINEDTEKLARVALKYKLYRFLRYNTPEMQNQIKAFEKDVLNYPTHSCGLIDVPKFLADFTEAIIGAVSKDSSHEIMWKVFKKLLEPIIDFRTLKIHPMVELLEFCQKKKINITFVDVSENDKYKTFNVLLEDDSIIGSSTCPCTTKKEIVKNRAAKDALEYLKAKLSLDELN